MDSLILIIQNVHLHKIILNYISYTPKYENELKNKINRLQILINSWRFYENKYIKYDDECSNNNYYFNIGHVCENRTKYGINKMNKWTVFNN